MGTERFIHLSEVTQPLRGRPQDSNPGCQTLETTLLTVTLLKLVQGVGKINKLMGPKHFTQCLAHSRVSIMVGCLLFIASFLRGPVPTQCFLAAQGMD